MRKFAVPVPLLALIAGIAGYFLRRRELDTVFDEVTGLAARGASATTALIGLVAAVLIVFLAFSIAASVRNKPVRGQPSAFCHMGRANLIAFSLLGIAWIVAAVIYYLNIRSAGTFPVVETYFSLLSGIAGVSVLLHAIVEYKNSQSGARLLLSVIPALFMCFWLILMYKRNAANPVLLKYCYQCLAVLTAALSFYFSAGYVFGKAAPGKTVLSFLTAIFFCCVTLADPHVREIKAVFAVIIIANLINAVLLISTFDGKKGRHEA